MIDMLVAEFSLEEALRVVVAKGQLIATALLALPIKPLSLNQLLQAKQVPRRVRCTSMVLPQCLGRQACR